MRTAAHPLTRVAASLTFFVGLTPATAMDPADSNLEHAPLHLSCLVEAVGAEDEKLLDELQALVERRRSELLLKKSAR